MRINDNLPELLEWHLRMDSRMMQDVSKVVIPKIIIDQRELRSSVAKELDKLGANLEFTQLEVGDYVLSNRVCIERKDIDDFFKSLFQDRKLFSQLIDVAEAYKRPILLLEGGDPFYSGRQVNPKAIQGILNAIALMRIPTLYSLNPAESAQIMYSIALKEQDEDKRPVAMHGKRSHMNAKQAKEYVISSFPSCNIGTVTAIELLNHFHSIDRIVNASMEQLQEVKGIGKVTAESLRKLVTEEY